MPGENDEFIEGKAAVEAAAVEAAEAKAKAKAKAKEESEASFLQMVINDAPKMLAKAKERFLRKVINSHAKEMSEERFLRKETRERLKKEKKKADAN